tara:strand:- start:148 stop:408 length:261 start_codon:yes stop_codon:yes gene_type:complete
MENIVDYIIGLGILGIVIGIVYQGIKQADNIVGEPPVVEKKPVKLSKARLNALTKVQLEEKGKELGIEVDKKLLKSKIVNQVYKAQ